MFKESNTRKIVGLIVALLGSFALVYLLVATPIFNAIYGLFSTKNLAIIIQKVDYTALVEDSENYDNEAQESAEIVNTIMHSETINEILDLYMEDVNAVSWGEDATAFNEAAVKSILMENSSELVDEIAKNPSVNMSEAEIQAELNKVIDNHSGDIVNMLPSPEYMNEVFDENDLDIAAFTMSGKMLTTTFMIFIVAISIGIFFAKLYRVKGLIVLSVDYVISAVITFAISAVVGMDALVDSLNEEVDGLGDILINMSAGIRTWALVIGVFAIVFFIAGIIGGKMCKNVELTRAAEASGANPYANGNANPYNNVNQYGNVNQYSNVNQYNNTNQYNNN